VILWRYGARVVDMKSQFAVDVLSFGVISSNVALAFGLTSSEPAPASSPGSSREYVRVAGQRLIAAGDREFRIRAIGAGSLSADPIEDDYERIAQLKFIIRHRNLKLYIVKR